MPTKANTLLAERRDPRTDTSRSPQAAPLVMHPGDVLCVNAGVRLQTLLGSCVSICMTDVAHTVGAMCHYVHSTPPRHDLRHDAHYAEVALSRMFAELRCRGIDPLTCDAYVCGGGAMRLHGMGEPSSIGARNVQWARQFLAAHRIATHVLSTGGGACYRKVNWLVGQGAPAVSVLPIEERP